MSGIQLYGTVFLAQCAVLCLTARLVTRLPFVEAEPDITALDEVARGGSHAPNRSQVMRQVRFSPDGGYLLAQDNFSVVLLTVRPLVVQLRVPAENVGLAQFTTNSREFFLIRGMTRVDGRQVKYQGGRAIVERWSSTEKRLVQMVTLPNLTCESEELSPDGETLVCVDFSGGLHLVDVPSSGLVYEREKFSSLVTFFDPGRDTFPRYEGDLGDAKFAFSPDGKFLVAVPWDGHGSAFAWDSREKRPIVLRGPLNDLNSASAQNLQFTFVSRYSLLMTKNWLIYAKGGVVTGKVVGFPDGKVLSKPRIPPGPLHRAADPSYVLIRPFGKDQREYPDSGARAAAVQLSTGQVIISENWTLDVWGNYYAIGQSDGRVDLYERGKGVISSVEAGGRDGDSR